MSVSTANPMQVAALEYAARGWRVLPLGRHGKIPRLKDWVNNASSDPEMILKWWDESYYEEETKFHGSTEYNVGIACGHGLVVVDVDGEEGEETLQFLLMQHDADINTLECHTGTGRHLYFQCDAELRNTASTFLGNKLDTRGAGGQVVAPPSIHPNGKTYEWANDLDPAPMPQWMLDLLLKPKGERLTLEQPAPTRRQPQNGGVIHPYDKPRFLEQLNFLARMPEGSGRNHKFNQLVFDAARMFRSGFCDAGYVEHEIKMAARSSGLNDREIEATWDSAWNAGLAVADPWNHPDRPFSPQPQPLPQRKKGKLVVTRLSEAEIQPVAFMWGYRIVRDAINVLAGDGGIGKALGLDTPILTTEGWKTQGTLLVGDQVFDDSGNPCTVTALSEVWEDRPCFEVGFSDGTTIVADENHEWPTWNRAPKRDGSKRDVILRTTREISRSLVSRKTTLKNQGIYPEYRHSIQVAPILQGFPIRELSIDPYVLGVWLGDGTSASNGLTCFDDDILDEIRFRGYGVTEHKAPGSYGIKSNGPRAFRAILRDLGVLSDKHIPESYMRSSVQQRIDLLCGLMDSDGCVAPGSCNCEFTSTIEELAYAVLDLTRSLGLRATIGEGRATLNGKDCGPKWRVHFAARDFPVFKLSRKALACKPTRYQNLNRTIRACVPVESRPVRCIQVDSPSHLYLAGESLIATHNSTLALHVARSITNLEETAALPDDDGQRIHGEVLLVAYEDHLGRILQQSDILGVNTENFHVIEGRREEDGIVVPFGMADIPDLIEYLDDLPAVRMLIIDPWTEFMNDNPNQEEPIRAALKPLNALAKDKNITVLILAHTNKRSEFNNAVDRIAGHGALKNRSRSTLMVGRTEAGQIAIAHAKANASQPASTFLYEWDDDKRWDKGENPFVWIGKSSLTPNEVFAQRSPTKVEAAQRWLRVMLAEGPMPAADIMQLADEEGFKTGTLNAAKGKVAISRKDGIGAWVWELKR